MLLLTWWFLETNQNNSKTNCVLHVRTQNVYFLTKLSSSLLRSWDNVGCIWRDATSGWTKTGARTHTRTHTRTQCYLWPSDLQLSRAGELLPPDKLHNHLRFHKVLFISIYLIFIWRAPSPSKLTPVISCMELTNLG